MNEKLDCTGLMCPMPIVKLSKAVKALAAGDTVEVTADDPAFEADVKAWCAKMKAPLKSLSRRGPTIVAVVEKA